MPASDSKHARTATATRKARAATKIQATLRGHICRLEMWAIGVLPLIRWVQIGSVFIPATYVRREATWPFGDHMLRVTNPEEEQEALDLSIVGRRLEPNPQPVGVHARQLLEQQKRLSFAMSSRFSGRKLLPERAIAEYVEASKTHTEEEENRIQRRNTRAAHIDEVIVARSKIRKHATTAKSEMQRARRRLIDAAPRWIQKVSGALKLLSEHGHRPLDHWRSKVCMFLEAARLTLDDSPENIAKDELLRAVIADVNLLSAEGMRARIRHLIQEGEKIESQHNRAYRLILQEYSGAVKSVKLAAKAALAMKRRVRRVNKETAVRTHNTAFGPERNAHEDSRRAASAASAASTVDMPDLPGEAPQESLSPKRSSRAKTPVHSGDRSSKAHAPTFPTFHSKPWR